MHCKSNNRNANLKIWTNKGIFEVAKLTHAVPHSDFLGRQALQIGSLAVPDEEVMHRDEGVLNGPPEVAEVGLPVAIIIMNI